MSSIPNRAETASIQDAGAIGRTAADRVITGTVCDGVHSREILPGHDLSLSTDRSAAIVLDRSRGMATVSTEPREIANIQRSFRCSSSLTSAQSMSRPMNLSACSRSE